MFRLSSSTVPYGTHPDLPQFDYRRQIEECAGRARGARRKARRYGIRLSTHPGQYTVLNSPDAEVVREGGARPGAGRGAARRARRRARGRRDPPRGRRVRRASARRSSASRAATRSLSGARARARGRRARRAVVRPRRRALALRAHGRARDLRHAPPPLPARCPPTRTTATRSPRRPPPGRRACARRCTCRARAPSCGSEAAPREGAGRRGRRRCSTSTRTSSLRGTSPSCCHAAARPVDVMIEAKAKDLAVEWLRVQDGAALPRPRGGGGAGGLASR